MDKFILEVNDDGQESAMHMDGDRIVFTESQDVTGLVEKNKARQNESKSFGDLQHVAELDLVTYQRLKREGIIDDKKRFMKWLDDPDNRFFRSNNMGLSRAKRDTKIRVK